MDLVLALIVWLVFSSLWVFLLGYFSLLVVTDFGFVYLLDGVVILVVLFGE